MAEEEFEQILLEIQLSEAMIQSYPVDSQDIFRTGFMEDILYPTKYRTRSILRPMITFHRTMSPFNRCKKG